jgi:hypothetical protein
MNVQPNDSEPPNDLAAALSNVEDEQKDLREAVRWAAEALVVGKDAEELERDLLAEGWTGGEAEEIVETARKETRRERGVVTRDDVVRDLNARYRQATGGLSVAFRSGLFGLYGFTTGVMAAWRAVRKLKTVKRKRGHREGPN